MASRHNASVLPTVLLLMIVVSGMRLSEGTNFTIVNSCNETIWPGITDDNNSTREDGGFTLKPGQSTIFNAPFGWAGRIWARIGFNSSIVEFSLGDLDYYDASLVDGFNLPLIITPVKGIKGNCSYNEDLRADCPAELAAYSYEQDDSTTVLTCPTTDYIVTFCSSRNQTERMYDDNQLSCDESDGWL